MFTGEACVCCWIEMFASQLPSASEGEVKVTGILFLHLQYPNQTPVKEILNVLLRPESCSPGGTSQDTQAIPSVLICPPCASWNQSRCRWMWVETGVLSFALCWFVVHSQQIKRKEAKLVCAALRRLLSNWSTLSCSLAHRRAQFQGQFCLLWAPEVSSILEMERILFHPTTAVVVSCECFFPLISPDSELFSSAF